MGKELYVDNGTYEGQLMGTAEYLELCREWKPDVVVAPDVIGDAGKTVAAMQEFFDGLPPVGERAFKVMVVPQGSSIELKRRVFAYALDKFHPDILGLGLGAFDKDWRARALFLRVVDCPLRRIHILGIANLADLCFWSAFAESCDTSLPFHAAQDGVGVLDEKKKSTRLDWFDTLEGERLRLDARNVELVRRVLK